jgi:uncharacterized DUF497 family protein
MKLTFDPQKDVANIAKHGVSLVIAEDLEWDTLECKPDTRREYGEPRQIGYVMEDERLHCVVFVDRPQTRQQNAELSACERPINER